MSNKFSNLSLSEISALQNGTAGIQILSKAVMLFLKAQENKDEPCECDCESHQFAPTQDAAIKEIARRLKVHADAHQTCGRDWPGDAEFCVVYRTSTWPIGWDKESSVAFFRSSDDLNKWIQSKFVWTECEDNYFAFQAYQWDLGPNIMRGNSINAHML